MELQDYIEKYKQEQSIHQQSVERFQRKIEVLSNMTQVSPDEFYENITTDKFYTASIENDKYEYVLGGDGRSSAWSEWREGRVLTVTVKNEYYLSVKLIEALRNYIENKFINQYDFLKIDSIRLSSI